MTGCCLYHKSGSFSNKSELISFEQSKSMVTIKKEFPREHPDEMKMF